jgi:hypothetical protein
MLPDPLHPAVVHLPLALALLSPFVALLGTFAIVRSWVPARAWTAVVLMQVLLAGSAWLALETGENEEDRVEDVVGEAPIDEHEEAAERFLAIAVAGMVVSAAGLLPGRGGNAGRLASVASGAVILAGAVAVGHSGGQLVYQHGAAQAYVQKAAAGAAAD